MFSGYKRFHFQSAPKTPKRELTPQEQVIDSKFVLIIKLLDEKNALIKNNKVVNEEKYTSLYSKINQILATLRKSLSKLIKNRDLNSESENAIREKINVYSKKNLSLVECKEQQLSIQTKICDLWGEFNKLSAKFDKENISAIKSSILNQQESILYSILSQCDFLINKSEENRELVYEAADEIETLRLEIKRSNNSIKNIASAIGMINADVPFSHEEADASLKEEQTNNPRGTPIVLDDANNVSSPITDTQNQNDLDEEKYQERVRFIRQNLFYKTEEQIQRELETDDEKKRYR